MGFHEEDGSMNGKGEMPIASKLCLQPVAAGSTVKFLPGFEGPLPFELETGYIGVGDHEDAQLFYYFIKSESNPESDPVLLWITGGPGCSALSGLIYEIGPITFEPVEYNGCLPKMILNPYSWTENEMEVKPFNKLKKRKKAEQGRHQPKKKFKEKCFNCGNIGHKFTDCRAPKKGKKKDQENMIESNKECDDLCAMFSECNLAGNPREWWMDSGSTRHVCANKELFSSFALAQVEEIIYMASSATAKVEGTGKICLKMTSRKVLTLNNVLYVLDLRRNLISVSLLDKNGFKFVTVSGKIVISKGEMYVGKG
ncbi:Serine carboxypeptidase-like 17 [Capsicum chinense]|nr:Serine carboxypeptidase-like 17 [Capsicum chinense]